MKVVVFTLVLNGMPWIGSILTALNRSHVDWQWIIIEGAAQNVACSSHCKPLAPQTSHDGTHEFLESISSDPRIQWSSRPSWPGKIAMVNHALEKIKDECVLIQMDSDEIWDARDIDIISGAMAEQTFVSAMRFNCRYFVGPGLVATSPKIGGTDLTDWVRVWRYELGVKFLSHCPPVIEGQRVHFSSICFDHYAYVLESQVRFKELYYGFDGMSDGWKRLQAHDKFPVPLRDFWPYGFVDEGTLVSRI